MEIVTKNDLEIFSDDLIKKIEKMLEEKLGNHKSEQFNWLRSKEIRSLMKISAATLQNLRISGKIRYKKIMGSYYYNNDDLQNLFKNDN
ncbi:helix-turn-helix domain-containing protein [Sphingobacterium paramultivorum]|uniref:helix-turn-helix domain-containing protein n=1 Tax=Sphingobacterium paramultivorum TaxID=2886510 RepID=UPI00129CD6C6|nr:helix-turn-helix domain-containing protein [Sphingobacterium paramultivorum]